MSSGAEMVASGFADMASAFRSAVNDEGDADGGEDGQGNVQEEPSMDLSDAEVEEPKSSKRAKSGSKTLYRKRDRVQVCVDDDGNIIKRWRSAMVHKNVKMGAENVEIVFRKGQESIFVPIECVKKRGEAKEIPLSENAGNKANVNEAESEFAKARAIMAGDDGADDKADPAKKKQKQVEKDKSNPEPEPEPKPEPEPEHENVHTPEVEPQGAVEDPVLTFSPNQLIMARFGGGEEYYPGKLLPQTRMVLIIYITMMVIGRTMFPLR